jgi:hypothetical protein
MRDLNLRDHGRVATRAHANDGAGNREHLIGNRRTVVGSHFEEERKKKKERDEVSGQVADILWRGKLNADRKSDDGERYRHC